MNNIVQLHAGAASARLVPQAGARVSALHLVSPTGKAVEVLRPYPEDFFDPIRWAKGGIYPLMPYSNRIADATLRVNGATLALAPHPDAAPHTLHGNAHAQAWQVAQADAGSAVLTLDSASCAAWPWRYAGRMHLQLTACELVIHIEIRNTSAQIMPAGIGLHPYFCHHPGARLQYQASTVWPPTADFLAGPPRAPQSDEIYAAARSLPAGGLTHYVGGWDGTAWFDLPQGARLQLSADPVLRHLVVHRPDNLAYLCLEPVSHVADGFNMAAHGIPHTGTRLLGPGASLAGTLRLRVLGDEA